jgi:NADPH-dependent curcumin reductase CurA
VCRATLADGEVLVRNHYLSLDPYMRGRMSAAKSYAARRRSITP